MYTRHCLESQRFLSFFNWLHELYWVYLQEYGGRSCLLEHKGLKAIAVIKLQTSTWYGLWILHAWCTLHTCRRVYKLKSIFSWRRTCQILFEVAWSVWVSSWEPSILNTVGFRDLKLFWGVCMFPASLSSCLRWMTSVSRKLLQDSTHFRSLLFVFIRKYLRLCKVSVRIFLHCHIFRIFPSINSWCFPRFEHSLRLWQFSHVMMTLRREALSVTKDGTGISMSHIVSYGNFSPQLELSDVFLDLRDSKDFSSHIILAKVLSCMNSLMCCSQGDFIDNRFLEIRCLLGFSFAWVLWCLLRERPWYRDCTSTALVRVLSCTYSPMFTETQPQVGFSHVLPL